MLFALNPPRAITRESERKNICAHRAKMNIMRAPANMLEIAIYRIKLCACGIEEEREDVQWMGALWIIPLRRHFRSVGKGMG